MPSFAADPYSQENQEKFLIAKEVLKQKAKIKHLNFIHYLWNNQDEPFIIGRHTRIICEQIDSAIEEYKKNRSVFKVIMVPFRHGKAFRIDMPVLTLDGWKKHGEIVPGDFVFNQYGEAVMVEGVTPKYQWNAMEIEFDTGEKLITAPEHEWPLSEMFITKKDDIKTIDKGIVETKQIVFERKKEGAVYPIIVRYGVLNELAQLHNGINVNKTFVQITNIKRIGNRPSTQVNCLQVVGGIYLIGKSLIPTHNSEIISRKLPAHYLGMFPDGKVLMTGHTAALAVGYSKESRDLIENKKYKELFPDINLNFFDKSASHWKVHGHNGEVFACGLGGSMAGQGYTLGIVDDYCRNRTEAESPVIRERLWNSFTNDFLTRRAPRSITLVTATPWHVDDIIGRIKKRMEEDPYFPRFEFITMPAFSDDYPQGVLFPERFAKEWYNEQRAALGEYGTASLLQCNPTTRGGNILRVDNVKKVKLTEFPEMIYYRIWDLAHTEKERTGQDPDYTSGTLLGYRKKPGAPRQWELWIKDVKRFRLDAPKRDNQIMNITAADGPYIKVGIENSIDSKDALKILQNILLGQRIVLPIKGKGDKVTRAAAIEPIFEAGDVYVPDGAPWLQSWIDELAAFPSAAHDDQVDNLSAGYTLICKNSGSVAVSLYGV